MGRFDSCLICATPRTGSTLLCGLLASTKVAGHTRTDQAEPNRPEQEPRFDFDQIRKLAQTIGEHNSAWRAWFASVGIRPHVVRYEALDADPVGTPREILDFLGLELPSGRVIETRNRRLADALNARWIDRYRAEAPAARNAL